MPQTFEQYEYIQCRIYHSEKKNHFVFILSESYMLTTDFSILVAKSSQKMKNKHFASMSAVIGFYFGP